MKVKVGNCDFEFLSEDLRHFKINSAKDLGNFIQEIKKEKIIGFKLKEKKR